MVGKVRKDCDSLTETWRMHGMVLGPIFKWLDAAWFGFMGGHTADATPRQRAAWWHKLYSVVEWAAPLSEYKNGKRRVFLHHHDVRTFTSFIKSARYAVREGEPVVLFDFDRTAEAIYVNVTDRGEYEVEAWGSAISTKHLYIAALFLYVEAVDEMCEGYHKFCETRFGY
jgi:hypothetical protein